MVRTGGPNGHWQNPSNLHSMIGFSRWLSRPCCVQPSSGAAAIALPPPNSWASTARRCVKSFGSMRSDDPIKPSGS